MKINLEWVSGMEFAGYNNLNDSRVVIDFADHSKGGAGKGTTPKQLFLQSIAGCTGIDIINILTRMRSGLPVSFSIDVEGDTAKEEPAVFTDILLCYHFGGEVDEKAVLKAVKLSQDKYCSISIMVKRLCNFEYRVNVNGVEIYREKNNLQ